jgi:hypothetical protein
MNYGLGPSFKFDARALQTKRKLDFQHSTFLLYCRRMLRKFVLRIDELCIFHNLHSQDPNNRIYSTRPKGNNTCIFISLYYRPKIDQLVVDGHGVVSFG